MRITRTWTISLPPEMSHVAEAVARQEQRTKSELLREALRLYLSQRGQPLAVGAGDRVSAAGELAEVYRKRHALRQPGEAALRARFRGVRRLHDQLQQSRAA